jgi:hypothetical protein
LENSWKSAQYDDPSLSTVESNLLRKQPDPKSADLDEFLEGDAEIKNRDRELLRWEIV